MHVGCTDADVYPIVPFSMNFAFDAVVMLTWSDWYTEPRSNRYHYASRFSAELPVYFVQPDAASTIRFESVEGTNIKIVHVPATYDEAQARRLDEALRSRGVHRPLLWIYNVYFESYIRICRPRLRVYHATEDYVTPTEGLRAAGPEVIEPIRRVLENVDLLIAVSDGVASAYRAHAGYSGPILVLRNGCDYRFWRDTGAERYTAPSDGARVVLFQGGINGRLDYDLLIALALRMPEWRFWFCGDAREGGAGWRRLARQANVVHWGRCSIQEVARKAQQALVGIIPFKQDPWIERSLPLKAYEYIACGMPVVSVPIDALIDSDALFAIEKTAQGFAAAIERLAPTRYDPQALAVRRAAAREQSYDRRFAEMAGAIGSMVRQRSTSTSQLNILMLYDEGSTFVRTIYEHLVAFDKYSRHRYHFLSATRAATEAGESGSEFDFGCFDAIAIHYSVRVSVPQHITREVAAAVARYRGPKLLFIQDEYEGTETARQWIEALGIDSVYTNMPLDQVPLIYPSDRFPRVDFVKTLTGYVPDDPELDSYALPLAARPIWLGYRGRQLPHHYGALGYEKYRIGRDMRALCAARDIPADIEIDFDKRIAGTDWYRFVGSCRAMLGTETGSEVFDFDGSLKLLSQRYAALSYEEFHDRFLKNVPTPVDMRQVSPKIFEAIRLRTALVLFEGEYSGVVEKDTHYIPLKKDYSNIEEVLAAIADLDYLQELTERAYRDIIKVQRYSYRSFVEECDRYIDARVGKYARATIFSVPVVALYEGGAARPWPVSADKGTAVSRVVADGSSALEHATAAIALAIEGCRAEPACLGAPTAPSPALEPVPEPEPEDCAPPEPEFTPLPAFPKFPGERLREIAVLRATWRLIPTGPRLRLAGLIESRMRTLAALRLHRMRHGR